MTVLTNKNRHGFDAAERSNRRRDAELAKRRAAGERLTANGWTTKAELDAKNAALDAELDTLLPTLDLGEPT